MIVNSPLRYRAPVALLTFILIFGSSSCSQSAFEKSRVKAGEENAAENNQPQSNHLLLMRSVTDVNQILRSRIVPDQDFDILSEVLPTEVTHVEKDVVAIMSLRDEVAGLMGSYTGLGMRIATDSMRPSSVQLMLWGLVFQSFADDISGICLSRKTPFKLDETATSIIKRICKSRELQDRDVKDLWNILLRQDATEAEFQVWLLSQRDDIAAKDGSDRVASLVYAMLFGPEFLIGR